MNDGEQNRPMTAEANDPVWNLLGRAPMAQPGAWFTVRALARCHREGRNRGLVSIGLLWRWALGGGLGVCLAIGLLVAQVHNEKASKEKNVQEAFEIMATLNTSDSDSSSSSPWQDSSL